MIRYGLFLLAIISILVLTSCEPLGETITSTEEWGCLINSDGTGFEWFMRGPTTASFTQDSQKIVYRTSEGIFTRDFNGIEDHISTLHYSEYDLFSPDLKYLLLEENNDIYRMDIDGANKINLTNNPDRRNFNSSFSSEGNMITFLTEMDTTYAICIIDINGENLFSHNMSDIVDYAEPKINQLSNEIYYISNHNNNSVRALKALNYDDFDEKFISSPIVGQFGISGDGSVITFVEKDSLHNNYLYIFDVNSNEKKLISTEYSTNSIDYYGTRLAVSSGLVKVIELNNFEALNLSSGTHAVISPDGEKIFFIDDRKLPIED